MKYPKPIMSRNELITQMGLPESMLMRAFATPGQTFAWKANPAHKRSPILFDTDGFEEWRIKECHVQERARRMPQTVA